MKTKPTEITIESFLNEFADPKVHTDCVTIIQLMEKVTGEKPVMWGPSIIGFGKYHYKYDSGREGEVCLTGFSPRKGTFVFYVLTGFPGQADLLAKLGKHKTGKGCLYIKKLKDVDMNTLQSILRESVDFLKKKYPDQ